MEKENLFFFGPLTLLQTKVREIQRKFTSSEMKVKDFVEYNKAAKDLGIPYHEIDKEEHDYENFDEEHE